MRIQGCQPDRVFLIQTLFYGHNNIISDLDLDSPQSTRIMPRFPRSLLPTKSQFTLSPITCLVSCMMRCCMIMMMVRCIVVAFYQFFDCLRSSFWLFPIRTANVALPNVDCRCSFGCSRFFSIAAVHSCDKIVLSSKELPGSTITRSACRSKMYSLIPRRALWLISEYSK